MAPNVSHTHRKATAVAKVFTPDDHAELLQKLGNIDTRLGAAETANSDNRTFFSGAIEKLSIALHSLGEKFERSVADLRKDTNQSVSDINARLAERNATNWPVLLLTLGALGSVGVYALTKEVGPVAQAVVELKEASKGKLEKSDLPLYMQPVIDQLGRTAVILDKMNDRFMPASEINTRFGDEQKQIDKLQDNLVSRREHEEHWHSIDQRLNDVSERVRTLELSRMK